MRSPATVSPEGPDPTTATLFPVGPLPAWYISVYCPVEVAKKREQADTGRALGPARLFHEGVYRYGVADLVVNTAASNPHECAQQIKQYMNSGSPPHAFRQLHRQFSQSP